MTELGSFGAGAYEFIPGVYQYSAGVKANDGFEIVRVRFHRPLTLSDGFSAAADHLKLVDRGVEAFCACELRSPAPFTEQGFTDFNKEYVGWLDKWGLTKDGKNPVARTNVCPEVDPPKKVSMYAFSYTRPAKSRKGGSFVVAGSGEAPEGKGSYKDFAIRPGDQSTEGMLEKCRWVLGEMERRMSALGAGWATATGAHVYTAYELHALMKGEIAPRGAAASGLSWHFSRPPVQGLDYEMDVRGVSAELVI
ncbi:hypothetical protein [Bradyrhizobium sp.]|uniref:2-amino-5-chloromuconate deaminase CnbZ n=1 Tax=Bradyrhizobium sp. TaxID=376 RepID=UPI0039E48A77